MNIRLRIFWLSLFGFFHFQTHSQSFELQQLILNVEKLAQFKQILADMKSGYDILSQGYETVKNISEGNFSLHEAFLDGLLQVSPSVRKYKRIVEIGKMQVHLVEEYKSAWKRLRETELLNSEELDYIAHVYEGLVQKSLRDLESLVDVLTAGKLRMNDDQRLEVIDGIYQGLEDKLKFLRVFNNQNYLLIGQRQKAVQDAEGVRRMYFAK